MLTTTKTTKRNATPERWTMKTSDGSIHLLAIQGRWEVYRQTNGTGYNRFLGFAKTKIAAMDIAFGRV